MSALHDLTALEQAEAIRAGHTTAVEITEHYLHRSEHHGDTVGAFVRLTPDLALDQARAADAQVRSTGQDEPLPPLLGVVCPIKDLANVAGVETSYGSAVVELTAHEDDNIVAKLRSKGLVFTGKTNTPEFGLPCYTEPDVAPPARTPWDLTRSAGGSSGGAAAAVAAGLAPIAHGNDGGGSVRIPAAVCGLVGIKPSRGRVSNGPLGYSVGDITTSGPLARTTADAAALLDAMAGHFTGDPFSAPPPVHGTFLAAALRPPGALRIGLLIDPALKRVDLHPDVRAAMSNTAASLARLGHDVIEVKQPFETVIRRHFEVLWSSLAGSIPIPPELAGGLRPLTRWHMEQGRSISADELVRAIAAIRALSREAMIATDRVDVVAVPTLAQPPVEVGALRNDEDPAADFEAQVHFSPFTAVYNATGQPAINVPLNWNAQGLPIGIQLVGRMYEEEVLISLCAQLEAAYPWRDRRPQIW